MDRALGQPPSAWRITRRGGAGEREGEGTGASAASRWLRARKGAAEALITDGVGSSGGGYRVELFRRAVQGGHEITFVGRQANGPNGNIEGQAFPRNHEGYSGATIATGGNQLANRVDAVLAANPPDIVLLHIGTNDIYQGMPANLPEQLGDLLDQITSGAPDVLVVVAQITPVAEAGAQFTFPNNGVDEYKPCVRHARIRSRASSNVACFALSLPCARYRPRSQRSYTSYPTVLDPPEPLLTGGNHNAVKPRAAQPGTRVAAQRR